MWTPDIPSRKQLLALCIILAALGATFGLGKYLDTESRQRDPAIQILAGLPAEHGIEPKTIHIKQGQSVTVRLTSKDVTYAFLVPAFNIDEEPIKPGVFTILKFVPDKAGTFPFYCIALSGNDRLSQSGVIIVEP